MHWKRRREHRCKDLEKRADKATIASWRLSYVSLIVAAIALIIASLSAYIAMLSVKATLSVRDEAAVISTTLERQFARPWIIAGLRNIGGRDYVKGVEARIGGIVEGQIYIRNTTGHPSDFAVWVQIPSQYVSIVPNSVYFWDSTNTGEQLLRCGNPVDITRPTLIGTLQQYDPCEREGWFTVTFQMQIENNAINRIGSTLHIVSTVAVYDENGRLAANAQDYATHIVITD